MRKVLLCGAVAVAALFSSKASLAYDGPWCAVINQGFGAVSENCSMPSFEVCRREAAVFGPTSFCRQNGRFADYWQTGQQRRHVARKKHRQRRAH